MKIQDCKFTSTNILVGVESSGKVFLGNIATGEVYEVSVVKKTVPKKLKKNSELKLLRGLML